MDWKEQRPYQMTMKMMMENKKGIMNVTFIVVWKEYEEKAGWDVINDGLLLNWSAGIFNKMMNISSIDDHFYDECLR